MIGALVERARRAWRRKRARRLIRASGLFDAAWYGRTYPDARGDLLDDYLTRGAADGCRPHPLFDTAWYMARNADVTATGANPLVHYIQAGGAEGRDPNPYFFGRWYLANNAGSEEAVTPLTHYLREGGKRLRDPSPKFDARWYFETQPDVQASGLDPLSHYLAVGRAEGRAPTPFGDGMFRGAAVNEARLTAFKALEPVVGEVVALMTAHCPEGLLKPNVGPYVAALRAAGVKVVLVAAADRPFTVDPAVGADLAGGFVRDNRGYDFAAWAHLLRAEPSLYAARTLLLVNDSLIGPTDPAALAKILARIEASDADLVGATDSREQAWHLQSFFLALKPRALASYVLRRFFDSVRSLEDKDHVIRAYELTLTETLQSAGFNCEALFPSQGDDNPTIVHWRELLRRGFPFVKTLTLRGIFPQADIEGWRETLARAGYDLAVAEATVATPVAAAEPTPDGWPLLRPPARAPQPRAPYKVAFIGPWNYASGLGVAARGNLSALWRTGFRLNIHPIERPFSVHARVAPTTATSEFDGPADAVIVQLNPDAWSLMTEDQLRIVERARVRVGHFVWEMEEVPELWMPGFAKVDAIWGPSRYCAEAYARATGRPVQVVPYVNMVPPPGDGRERAAMLQALGMAQDARLILYVFDGSSFLVRKNPDALVRAFAASGLQAQGWRLVLKTKHLGGSRQGQALTALAHATPGTLLIDDALPPRTMTALFEAADIYASPHRSEGFGLTIAEAMAAGKLVVATDYGGSCDFLDASTGLPVPARRVASPRTEGPYLKGWTWGDPDEAALAAALAVAAERIAAGDHSLGQAARRRIQAQLSPDAVAGALRDALEPLIVAARDSAA